MATFKLSKPIKATSITVKGDGPNKFHVEGAGSISSDTITLPATASTNPLPDSISKIDPFAITWTVTVNGKDASAGQSSNKMYITLHDPILSSPFAPIQLYETLLELGSVSAAGQKDDASAVPKIWSTFAGLNVKRVDGVQMGYWTGGTATCQNLQAMLTAANGNGSCIAWSQLLDATWKVQGISGSDIYEINADPALNTDVDGFLVKNWAFANHIRTGPNGVNDSTTSGDDYTVIPKGTNGGANMPAITPGPNGKLDSTAAGDDTVQDGLFNGSTYPYLLTPTCFIAPCAPADQIGDPMGDASNQPGIKGQNNPEPPPYFFNHFVVKYSGQVYDPSYGAGPFGGEFLHQTAAIDGLKSKQRAKKPDLGPLQDLKYCLNGCH
jgi:hypothetical protein